MTHTPGRWPRRRERYHRLEVPQGFEPHIDTPVQECSIHMCTFGWVKDQWGFLDGYKKPRIFSWRVHACSHFQHRGSRLKTAWYALGSQLETPQPKLQSVPGLWLLHLLLWPCSLTWQQPLPCTRRSQGSYEAPQSRGWLPPPQEERELSQDCSCNTSGPYPNPGPRGNHNHAKEKLSFLRTVTPALRIWPHPWPEQWPTSRKGEAKPSWVYGSSPSDPNVAETTISREKPGLTLGFGFSPSRASITPHQCVSHRWPPEDSIHTVSKSSSLIKATGHKLHKMGTYLNIIKVI